MNKLPKYSLWHSLRFKSSVMLLLLILATVLLLAGLSLSGIKAYQTEQLEAYLASQARTANVLLAETDTAKGISEEKAKEVLRQMTVDRFMSAQIFNMEGKLLRSSILNTSGLIGLEESQKQELAVKDTPLSYALSGKISYTKLGVKETYGDPMVDYYAPLSAKNKQVGVLRLTYRYQSYEVFYDKMANRTAVAAVVVFTFSAVLGLWYFGRQAVVIENLEEAVRAVTKPERNNKSKASLSPYTHRKDELGRLALGIGEMSQTINEQIEKLEQEHKNLSLAIEKLKQMELKQRQFFGNITHEFKTPLSVINAYNDLTEMYSEDLELLENSRRQIKNEVIRLTAMVEQSLELSKIEQYSFEIKKQRVNIYNLIDAVVKRLSVKAEKYNITLSVKPVDLNHQEPDLLSDEDALTHVLMNLIDNAIKYNKMNGYVHIDAHYEPEINAYILDIKDTGRGIPQEAMVHLFEPFESKNTENLTQVKGSGLGLTLVKRQLEALGASIKITSEVEIGTEVRVTLPLS